MTSTLAPLNVLGLMSGTSLDGVDAVLARLERIDGALHWQVQTRETLSYTPALREKLTRALSPQLSDVVLLTQVHADVGRVYAELVKRVMGSQAVDLVALSGQTVYHIPRLDVSRGWHSTGTLQLGEAAYVAEGCRVMVMSDFRQADMAAGGQGAPLVPFGDLNLYNTTGVARAVHNLGGISNLTYLPADGSVEGVFAFDTGAANCLIDEAMQRHYGRDYDENGEVAASGKVDRGVLESLLSHPYFRLPPPKTTGREVFNLKELEREYALEPLSPPDLIATLTAFTAESVARAYQEHVLPKGLDEILVAGGGALNPTLIKMLQERLPVPVETFETRGYNSKDREALAFAVMAYFAYYGLTNTLPGATGANHAVVGGKLSGSHYKRPV